MGAARAREEVDACTSEYLRIQLTGSSAVENFRSRSTVPTEDEAAKIHLNNCESEPKYAAAIVTCWSAVGCDAFAACVNKQVPLGIEPPR